MKKFLFTLAALLMVGTVCAENYWYIDDFQVTQAQLGTNNQRINVKAHYDQYVSAIQATFTMPEGLQIRTYRAGSDLTMSGYDDLGDPITSTPDLQFLPDHIENFIVASMASCYDQDGNLLGAFHWAPGDYAQMLQIVLIIDENFAGGEITVKTEPSSSGWADGSQDCPKNEEWTRTCTVTVEGAEPPAPAKVADPVVSFVEDGDVLTVTWTCETEGAELFIDGVSYGTMPYSYSVTRTYEDQVIAGTAVAKKADMEDSNAVPFSYTFEAKEKTQTPDPEITMAVYDTYVTITATGEGEVWLLVGEAEAEGNGSASININRTYEDFTVMARAKAYGNPETQTESALVSKEFTVPAMNKPVATTPTIEFIPTMNGEEVVSVEVVVTNATEYHIWVNDDQIRGEVIYASYTEVKNIHVEATNAPGDPYIASNNEGNYTLGKLTQTPSEAPQFNVVEYPTYVEVYATGPNVILYDEYGQEVDPQPYVIPRPAYDPEGSSTSHVMVSATTQQEGDQYAPTTVTYDVVVPMQENPNPPTPDQVGAPIFAGYTQDGVTGYGVTITPTTEGSSIKYRVFVWVPNEEGDTEHVGDLEYGHWDLIQDWTDYQGVDQEIWKTEVDASYRVEAYAYIGDVQSNTVATEFTVEKTPETGINEMVNGKSIANVRYFNMAGQEMQEANGVTIVVTTYTDGTTSAVKVMK